MFHRERGVGDRLRDLTPALVVLGLGAIVVAIAMNVLAIKDPVLIDRRPTPTPTATLPTFASIPSYAIVTDTPDVSPLPSAVLPSTRPTILTKRLSEHDPNGVWELSMAYPQFLGSSTPLATLMNGTIGDFERDTADQWEEGAAANRQLAGKVNHFVGTFTTDYVSSTLASFTLTWSDDTIPGQLVLGVTTFNFDLGTGQPIAFDDLFTDPDAALSILSTQTGDLLYYQLGAAWDEARGTAGTEPDRSNFLNFAVTPAGLKITFNQYQVVLTDVTPSVVVPWSALMPVLRPTGPVAELTGANVNSPGVTASPAAAPTPSPTPQTGS